MIGIVMPCYDREIQLKKTLSSILETRHTDYHIVIVDDASPTPLDPSGFLATVLSISPADKTWINPVVPINMGIAYLLDVYSPDIVIIQNTECYHVGDVLSYANTHVTDESYLSFGCISIEQPIPIPNDELQDALATKLARWYNHPVHKPAAFGWCVAMSAKTVRALNGYDERFKDVMGGADRDLVERAINLGCNIEITESPFVVHQYHSRHYRRGFPTYRSLYPKIELKGDHRAMHLITEDF